MVVPGMQDAHIHPISGGIEANGCDLNAATTVDEYVAIIKKYADEHPDEPWIKGGGWLMSAFGPGALARKELIDAVVPDRPVILWSRDGHTTWVNSKALELAGITKDTQDPPDGRIDRDPKTGEAIGSLQEGASSLVADKAPPDTDATRDAGLRYAIKMLNGFGITGRAGRLGQRGGPQDLPPARRGRRAVAARRRLHLVGARPGPRADRGHQAPAQRIHARAASMPAPSRSCRTA